MQSAYVDSGYQGDGYQWPSDEEAWNNTADSIEELPDVGEILGLESSAHDSGLHPQQQQQGAPPDDNSPEEALAQLSSGQGRFEQLRTYCRSLYADVSPASASPDADESTPMPSLEGAAALRTALSPAWQQRYSVASFLLRQNPHYLRLDEEIAGKRIGLSLVGLPGSGKSSLMNVLAGDIVSPVSNHQGNAELKEAVGYYSTTLRGGPMLPATSVTAEYRLRDLPGFLGPQAAEATAPPQGVLGALRSWLSREKPPPTCAREMPINDKLAQNYLRRYEVVGRRPGERPRFGRAEVVAFVLNQRVAHLDVLMKEVLEGGAVAVLVVTHSSSELALLEGGDVPGYLAARAERLLGLVQASMQADERLQATALSLPAFFIDIPHANTPLPHTHPDRAAGTEALIRQQLARGFANREVAGLREYLARGAVERARLFRYVDRKLEEELRGFHIGRSWASFLAEVGTNAAALGGGPLGPVVHSFLMSLTTLAGMMDAAGLLPPGSWRTRLAEYLKASVQWESLEKASLESTRNAFFAAVKGGLGLVGANAWDFVDDLVGLAARETLTTLVPFFGTALYALTLSYMRRRMACAVAGKARLVHRRWIMENL